MSPALRLSGCALAALAVAALAPGAPQAVQGMALFVFIGGLWLTQALPLAVTALLVPLLATATGLLPLRQALAPFAHPVLFLFLGGFALGAALSHQGLDQALARAVLHRARGHRLLAVCLLGGLSAVLSMWMSNTATAALMVPLALGLLRQQEAGPAPADGGREAVFVLLVLAYSASIGGIATLVGSPPNAIAAAQAGMGFAQWLAYGLPLALLLWPVMVALLWWLLRPRLHGRVALPTAEPLAWTPARRWTVAVFALAVLGWVAGQPLARALGWQGDTDTLVALAVVVALAGTPALGWKAFEQHTPWGVLLLFGGGLALSEVMGQSGASLHLGQGLLALTHQVPPALMVLALIAFVVLLTELVSNTASAALLLPIFLPVASALGLSGPSLAAAVAVAASCAFMLPVATPPNALVFATGQVPQALMVRCGAWLNGVCVLLIAAMAEWVWPR